jgi:hypothetical protein
LRVPLLVSPETIPQVRFGQTIRRMLRSPGTDLACHQAKARRECILDGFHVPDNSTGFSDSAFGLEFQRGPIGAVYQLL